MKTLRIALAALALGAGSLFAQDYDELRYKIEQQNYEIEEQARKLRNLSVDADIKGDIDLSIDLSRAARELEDSTIDLW